MDNKHSPAEPVYQHKQAGDVSRSDATHTGMTKYEKVALEFYSSAISRATFCCLIDVAAEIAFDHADAYFKELEKRSDG